MSVSCEGGSGSIKFKAGGQRDRRGQSRKDLNAKECGRNPKLQELLNDVRQWGGGMTSPCSSQWRVGPWLSCLSSPPPPRLVPQSLPCCQLTALSSPSSGKPGTPLSLVVQLGP